MYKLVAIDMDGTLLDDHKNLSSANIEVIKEVMSRNIQVTFATGRMFSSAHYYARQVGITLPMVNFNGALIKEPLTKRELNHLKLKIPVATKVLQYLQDQGVYCKAYVNDVLYTDENYQTSIEFAGTYRVVADLVADLTRIPAQVGAPSMIVILEPKEVIAQLEKDIRRMLGEELFITQSREDALELLDRGASKGKGLTWLARWLNILPEEVLSIGDNRNDLELFDVSGFSVAMGNGADVAKEKADFVTLDNNHDGVAHALREILL